MDLREARRKQTLCEADRLTKDVEAWVDRRTADDKKSTGGGGRYQTQLSAISAEVDAATSKVRGIAAGDTVTNRTAGEVFSDYNLHDQRLIWIRYAWSYFRDKLDQRDDGTLRPALEAADEVSWSCYHVFFEKAGLTVPAAPIPYIEYDYVPSALRTSQAHVLNRRPGSDPGPLKAYFAALPVPLLRLPPATVTSPWSLLLIAHEVGHLLQASVGPGYFQTFSDRVVEKAAGAGATSDEQKQWAKWSPEIFADLCMAVTAGVWSVWALAPWVITREAEMGSALDYYPPPAVRLYLLKQIAMAGQFGEEAAVMTRLGLEDREHAIAKAVAGVVADMVTVNGKSRPIKWFLESAPEATARDGRAWNWSKALAEGHTVGEGMLAENDMTSARDAAAAATRAHFLGVQKDLDLQELAPRCFDLLKACHAKGVRGGTEPAPPALPLADALFQIRDEDLMG